LQKALHDEDFYVRCSVADHLAIRLIESYNTRQIHKMAPKLIRIAEPNLMEEVANHLSVLEVQNNPGNDPLSSIKEPAKPGTIKQGVWKWFLFVSLLLIVTILSILLLPATAVLVQL
jgi:hypothetical protein